MKNVLLVLGLLSALQTSAQTVDGVDIWRDSSIHYIQIVGSSGLFTKKVVINVDYGQKLSWDTDSRVDGPDGKIIKFNSMMDALNYFYSAGWDFVNAYAITVGNSNVYHYVLERGKK